MNVSLLLFSLAIKKNSRYVSYVINSSFSVSSYIITLFEVFNRKINEDIILCYFEYILTLKIKHFLEFSFVPFWKFQVETGSCFQRVFGNIQTALILKDISLEVRPGEVLAVLGSKGSGKRALLEVISRRSSGTTRGEIILDGTPMSPQLFQTTCGYVNHRTDLIPSLSVEETLYYAAHLSIGPQVNT